MKLSKKLVGFSVGVASALIVVPSLAFAAIPDTSGVVHSCYNSGILPSFKIYDPGAGQNCGLGQTALTWNQSGGGRFVTGDSDTLATDANGVITNGHTADLHATCAANEYALQGIVEYTGSLIVPLFGDIPERSGTPTSLSDWVFTDGTGYTVGSNVGVPSSSGSITLSVICLPVPGLPS